MNKKKWLNLNKFDTRFIRKFLWTFRRNVDKSESWWFPTARHSLIPLSRPQTLQTAKVIKTRRNFVTRAAPLRLFALWDIFWLYVICTNLTGRQKPGSYANAPNYFLSAFFRRFRSSPAPRRGIGCPATPRQALLFGKSFIWAPFKY